MADTAKRLAGPLQLATAAATVYTVPALTTAIIQNIHAMNTTALDKNLTISVGVDAAGTRIFDTLLVPARGYLDQNIFLVMAAAEVLQAFSDVAGITLTVSGVEVA
jgi:hypothetical protein